MALKKIGALALAGILAFGGVVTAAPATAADVMVMHEQVTGKLVLWHLISGRQHVGTLADGTPFDVSYNVLGAQRENGKRTGIRLRATETQWCRYNKGVAEGCVFVTHVGDTYYAEDPLGTVLGTFTIQ